MNHASDEPKGSRRPLREDCPPQQLTRRIDSSELLAGAQEVQIQHEGQTYRLRRTKAGKLILTK